MVGGLRLELGGTGVDRLVHGVDAELPAKGSYVVLGRELCGTQLRDLTVGEPVVFGVPQLRRAELLGRAHVLPQLDDLLELVEEPRVDLGGVEQLLDGRAEIERARDLVEPSVGRGLDRLEQLVESASTSGPVQNPARLVSSERSTLPKASVKLRPIDMASPTDFMVVVRVPSAPGNFSNAKRGALTTT